MNGEIICEPVAVGPEVLLKAERDSFGPDSAGLGPFHHFHDVCELVWYSHAEGEMLANGGTYEIRDGTAFFFPAMISHQVNIGAGTKEWIYIHLDVALVMALVKQEGLQQLEDVVCCTFKGEQLARINMLFEWILDLARNGLETRPTLRRLVKLVLTEMCRAGNVPVQEANETILSYDRLRPALRLVNHDPTAEIDLTAAAASCNLSSAYFSRQFKLVLGMSFSEYVRATRLRLAAQRLISSGDRISDIAFDCGFSNPAHFTAVFKKKFGRSPRDYRTSTKYG